MAGGKPTMNLIYYTDKSSAEQILESGRINPSTEDAVCGPGTYMTKVPPSEGKAQIAANFGVNSQEKQSEGKMDVAITVQVPAEDVTRLTKDPEFEGKSVYKVEQGLDLNKLPYTVETVPDKPTHKMAGGKPTMTLTHYTDESSTKQILESGRINPSTEDAVCGPGTYMTKVPPSEGKAQAAANNYGVNSYTSQQKQSEGKMDVAITVQVPAEDVTRLTKDPEVEGRSIYKVEQGLDLSKLPYTVEKVPDKPRHN